MLRRSETLERGPEADWQTGPSLKFPAEHSSMKPVHCPPHCRLPSSQDTRHLHHLILSLRRSLCADKKLPEVDPPALYIGLIDSDKLFSKRKSRFDSESNEATSSHKPDCIKVYQDREPEATPGPPAPQRRHGACLRARERRCARLPRRPLTATQACAPPGMGRT